MSCREWGRSQERFVLEGQQLCLLAWSIRGWDWAVARLLPAHTSCLRFPSHSFTYIGNLTVPLLPSLPHYAFLSVAPLLFSGSFYTSASVFFFPSLSFLASSLISISWTV